MRFGKKLHYTLKYIVLGLPIILLMGLIFARTTEYYNFFETFTTSITNTLDNMATWYASLVEYLNINTENMNIYIRLIIYYPVYIFYVYLIDLLVDVLTFIPKFFHDLLNKDYLK